jgi:hypothetical protein
MRGDVLATESLRLVDDHVIKAQKDPTRPLAHIAQPLDLA